MSTLKVASSKLPLKIKLCIASVSRQSVKKNIFPSVGCSKFIDFGIA
jgi:hypothetical protein